MVVKNVLDKVYEYFKFEYAHNHVEEYSTDPYPRERHALGRLCNCKDYFKLNCTVRKQLVVTSATGDQVKELKPLVKTFIDCTRIDCRNDCSSLSTTSIHRQDTSVRSLCHKMVSSFSKKR